MESANVNVDDSSIHQDKSEDDEALKPASKTGSKPEQSLF